MAALAAGASSAPAIRIKCRLHPCPAYRIVAVATDGGEAKASTSTSQAGAIVTTPTLAQVRHAAAAAWHLPSANGLLIAVPDADGDEIALLEEAEWDQVVRPISRADTTTSSTPGTPLLRLALVPDPRTSSAASLPAVALAKPDQAPKAAPPKKSAVDERNEALANAFEAMLARSRSTETAPSRSREAAKQVYEITRSKFALDGPGGSQAQHSPVPSGSRNSAVSASTRLEKDGVKDTEKRQEDGKDDEALEEKRRAWQSRAEQLYGSLVGQPPSGTSQAGAAVSGENPHTNKASLGQDATMSVESADGPAPATAPPGPSDSLKGPEAGSDETISSVQTDKSGDTAPPPAPPPARPRRPVEDVNQELSSAWESMLARMR